MAQHCDGFGELEGKCKEPIAANSVAWCEDCEQARRDFITKQLEALCPRTQPRVRK
jgi:hypothetical protein